MEWKDVVASLARKAQRKGGGEAFPSPPLSFFAGVMSRGDAPRRSRRKAVAAYLARAARV